MSAHFAVNSKLGKFNFIIDSDLLYESDHAKLLSNFIDSHANDTCEVIIVDPDRGLKGKFIKMMAVLGYLQKKCECVPESIEYYDSSFKHSFVKLIKE